jgi:translation initiation factor 2 beta subunit (eIF-2beta)/eIF-5
MNEIYTVFDNRTECDQAKDVKDVNDVNNVKDVYDIDWLLDRAYSTINTSNKNVKLPQPKIEKKDRKTYFHNFNNICKILDRDPEIVRIYMARELQLAITVKENGSLKINGMRGITPASIEKLLRGYITQRVMCASCKSCKTTEQKIDRVTYLLCNICKSKRAFSNEN